MTHLKNFGLLLVGLLLLTGQVSAQFTETKGLQKSFQTTSDTKIEITNKYGKIEVIPWEKDSVVFDIEIRVEEKKLSKLEKSMDAIDFDFTQSEHFLMAKTIVGQNKSSLSKELMRFKENMFQTDGKIEINYTVWLPEGNELRVENKFGDIYLGDLSGEVEVDLSNGNLKSHEFTGDLKLVLNFADATINSVHLGQFDCSFSEVYVKKAGDVNITSRSTKFEFLEISDLKTNSKRDEYRIRKVDLLDAQGSFSNFRINKLSDRANMRVSYGDVDIDETPVDFSQIYIESKSTDINLFFQEEAKFNLEITYEKTELDLCRAIEKEEETFIDDKDSVKKIFGNYGGQTEGKSKLIVKSSSGELNILSN